MFQLLGGLLYYCYLHERTRFTQNPTVSVARWFVILLLLALVLSEIVVSGVSVARWFVILLLPQNPAAWLRYFSQFQLLGGLLYYCYDERLVLHISDKAFQLLGGLLYYCYSFSLHFSQ